MGAITWRNVDAPNAPNLRGGENIAAFTRAMANIGDSMRERQGEAQDSAAQKLFTDPNLSEEQKRAAAADTGNLDEYLALQKEQGSLGLQEARGANLQARTAQTQQKMEYAPFEQRMKQEKHQLDTAQTQQNMGIKGQEHEQDQRAQQLDTLLAQNDINIGELDPQQRKQLMQDAAQEFGPQAVSQSQLGKFYQEEQKAFQEGQKAYQKQSGKNMAEMDLYLGGNSMFGSSNKGGSRPRGQEPLNPQQAQALQQMKGELIFKRTPDGQYTQVPKSEFGKATPKNETEALERLVANPNLSNKLGLSPSTTGWFDSMNPLKWAGGSNRKGALSQGVKNLPEQDQEILGSVTKLMQMVAEPNDILQIVNKTLGEGRSKKELSRVLDLELHKLNSQLYGYAHQIQPNK